MNFFNKKFWQNLPATIKWIYILYLVRVLIYIVFYTVVFALVRKGLSDNWTDILPYMVFRKAHIAKAIGESGLGYSIGFLGVGILFRIIFSFGQIALLHYRKKVWYWIFLSFSVLQTIARFNIPVILIVIIILSLLLSTRKYLNRHQTAQNERIIDVFLDSDIDFK